MIEGVDISHHQGKADYLRVELQKFAFIIHKTTEGSTWQDPRYRMNRQRMSEFTTWGAYHLLRLDTPTDIAQEAENFLSHAKLTYGDLPPFLDVEHKWIMAPPSPEVDTLSILRWVSIVQKETGSMPVLYISPRGLRKLGVWSKYLTHIPLWVADYDQNPADEIAKDFQWLFWQYTSKGDGKAAGFESDGLDLDRFRYDASNLRALTLS